ncbi:MAG: ComEC/Rec2 family competence protein [Bacteroidota bacterium]
MPAISAIPMLRLLLPFMTGISLYLLHPYPNTWGFPLAAGLFLIFCLITFFDTLQPSYGREWKAGLILTSLMIVLGMSATQFYDARNQNSFFEKHFAAEEKIIATVDDPVSIKEKTVKVTVSLQYCGTEKNWQKISGRLLLWIEKDETSKALKYGDQLLLDAEPSALTPPANPNEFDYRRYLGYRNIYHQSYIKKNHWQMLSSGHGNPVFAFALTMRDRLLQTYRDAGIKGDEFAVIAALTAGYTDEIDPELRQAYASSGTLHVLSVSGLHVGIIFAVINFFLFFLNRRRHGLLIKAVIIILFLWFYAFMTGLSPPVLRAALMLSFIVAGKAMNRQTYTMNTILASAFLILLFNPFAIADIGFQLTYLAVIGIVILQQPVYSVFKPKNRIANEIWKLTAVSIAAQIATFPLSIFYFHQFPNFFLISNLVVIPISTVSIYAAIAALVFSGTPWLGEATALLLDFVVWLMNQTVMVFDNLPYATLTGIQSGVTETILLYGMITGLLFFILQNRISALKTTLVFATLLIALSVFRENSRLQQKVITVYHAGKATAVQLTQGKQSLMVFEERKNASFSKMKQRVSNDWTYRGTGEPEVVSLGFAKQNIFTRNEIHNRNATLILNNKRITLVSENVKDLFAIQKFNTDYLVITGNPKLSVATLKKLYNFSVLVIDASNSERKSTKWIAECEAMGIQYHCVNKAGALVVDF